MPGDEIRDLPIPIETRAQLKEAIRLVRQLRRDPSALLAWDPEVDLPLLERQRHELALSLELVLALGTGDGDFESRVKACQQLYLRNVQAPAEAVRTGELLFRSRLTTGATDVETFWLAASFAHALAPLAPPDLREIAHRYLCYAPFALDPHTALRFAAASRRIHRDRFPRWPLELAEVLLGSASHADLGATLLEAVVCAELEVRNMDLAGEELAKPLKKPSSHLTEAIVHLARHYVRTEADQVYAREVIRTAARVVEDAAPFVLYLADQIFDLPYDELYELVKVHADAPEELDRIYRTFVEEDRLHLSRRLVECELVRRLDPWKIGGIQPHIKRALIRTIGGADVWDPRVRELAIRLAILHSRTRHFTPEAQHLARRIAVLPEYSGEGSTLGAVREELENYLLESDPRYLLQRERALIADRWDELDDAERRVMDDVGAWMERKLNPRAEIRAAVNTVSPTIADAVAAVGGNRDVERAIEKALWSLYHRRYQGLSTLALRREIEDVIGVPYAEIAEADIERISALARSYANADRALASATGAVAGLVGGPWGLVLDTASVISVSSRSAARIGACFGIQPGTRAGFEFLIDALMMSVSTEGGEGLVAYLMDQRPRLYHAVTVGGVLYATGSTRRVLAGAADYGIGVPIGRAIMRASRLLGLGLAERSWARIVPVVGAILTSGADYLFLRDLTDAAVHLAARQWVLRRHGLMAGRSGDTLQESLEEPTDLAGDDGSPPPGADR